MQKIINAHCHIYPEKVAARATAGIREFYGLDRSLNGMTDDLIRDGSKVGVTHYLVHSVATKPEQVKSINEFIASEVNSHPGIFTGFGSLHPESADIEADIKHLVDLGLKGVKLHPDFQNFSLDEQRAFDLGNLIKEYDIPVLLHCGDPRYERSNPAQLEEFIKHTPGLTTIAAHLGGWSKWEEAEKLIAGKYDIYVDMSSSLAWLTPEDAVRIIRKYGVDRVMWGSDYPMWEHEPEMKHFEKLLLTEDEKQAVLYSTAAKLLGVD